MASVSLTSIGRGERSPSSRNAIVVLFGEVTVRSLFQVESGAVQAERRTRPWSRPGAWSGIPGETSVYADPEMTLRHETSGQPPVRSDVYDSARESD